jgi:predicted PurR-regulated permease PerM
LVNKAAARNSAEMSRNDNPLHRALAVLVAIAVGIRVIFWLLQPVWPYLLAALVLTALCHLARWYWERW